MTEQTESAQVEELSIKCANAMCRRIGKRRGLCGGHYEHYRRMVARGETTWQELEAEGKSRPSRIVEVRRTYSETGYRLHCGQSASPRIGSEDGSASNVDVESGPRSSTSLTDGPGEPFEI